jgi:hypothetical protein
MNRITRPENLSKNINNRNIMIKIQTVTFSNSRKLSTIAQKVDAFKAEHMLYRFSLLTQNLTFTQPQSFLKRITVPLLSKTTFHRNYTQRFTMILDGIGYLWMHVGIIDDEGKLIGSLISLGLSKVITFIYLKENLFLRIFFEECSQMMKDFAFSKLIQFLKV